MEPRPNYRVTRHVEFEEDPKLAALPPKRPQDPKYHSQLISLHLEPALGAANKNLGKVQHALSSVDSDVVPFQVVHRVSSFKEPQQPMARDMPISPVPVTMEPAVEPVMQTPAAIRQMKELSNSRKSNSSGSARQFKDKLREQLQMQPVKTRVISDPGERLKLEGIPNMQTTPPTAQKFWKDALKESRIEIHYNAESPEEIAPVFRYCFVCENSILEYNIAHHQKVCPRFDELYNKSGREIAQLLDRKIGRIKAEMNAKIQDRGRQNMSPMEPAISSVREFLTECEKVEQRGNHQLHYEYESKFIKVEDCWSDLKLLELAHRLRWFMRIRQQLRTRFDL